MPVMCLTRPLHLVNASCHSLSIMLRPLDTSTLHSFMIKSKWTNTTKPLCISQEKLWSGFILAAAFPERSDSLFIYFTIFPVSFVPIVS